MGAVVALIALIAAVVYGPGRQGSRPANQKVEQPTQQPVAAPPAVRGPVVREVPQ